MDILNLKDLFKSEPKNKKYFIGNQKSSNICLTIANISQVLPNKLNIIITPDIKTAKQLEQEIPVFLANNLEQELDIQLFPDWETLPYDHFSPHQDITSDRLKILANLSSAKSGILICPINSLMAPTPAPDYLAKYSLNLKVGEILNLTKKRRELEKGGYLCVQNVLSPGEFAVRGSLLDIYPMGSNTPYRIDLFDDEIESIKEFDPETQKSGKTINNINLLPAREFPLDENAIDKFCEKFDDYFPRLNDTQLTDSIKRGAPLPGMEYYLPLFFDKTYNLLDFIPEDNLKNTQIILSNLLNLIGENLFQDIQTQYEQMKYHEIYPPILPKDLFTPINFIFEKINQCSYTTIQLQKEPLAKINSFSKNIDYGILPDLKIEAKAENPQNKISKFIKENETSLQSKIIFCAHGPGRLEHVKMHLIKCQKHPVNITSWQDFYNSKDNLAIMIAPISKSIYLPLANLIFIAETDLFENYTPQRRIRSRAKSHMQEVENRELFADLSEIPIDQAVVHLEHGIGVYKGLETLKINNETNDFLKIIYKKDDVLYVPVHQINLISKYQALNTDVVPLSHLGTDKWSQEKEKALKRIRDVAAELLDIYAKRALKQGFAMTKLGEDDKKFAEEFNFELTPDQARAIDEIINDLKSKNPADRLLCGDVGFGKTEVAMRACFHCIQNMRQVAVLVPTTLLGQQHGERFEDRFANWPIEIAVLSRFKSAKEQTKIKEKLASGHIDLVIGTHKLLSDDIKFKNLGLLIIDEEHRFGVSQKEKLKALRSQVDILSMTATPIPRTLNMAFSKIRDLSIISTPPAKRLNVKTFVKEYSINPIKEAILRETHRSGQVFYLHNDVKTIQIEAHKLSENMPDIQFGIAHGQMRPAELEKIMADFYHQKFQVLICSTIIETGIDIPNANTIIINRADKLGLAQLHQLRGRVGRSHHQAYAYLLTPEKESLNKDAIKRLKAIETTESLSAGLTLATHDLEIRGAGDLLGKQQSGQINNIGFHLYSELLEQTIKAMQSGKDPSLQKSLSDNDCKLDFAFSLIIPDNYLPDVGLRLRCYKQITHAKDDDQLDQIKINMIDRFGSLPMPTEHLFASMHLKLLAKSCGVVTIRCNLNQATIAFEKSAPINIQKLMILASQQPEVYQLLPDEKVRIKFKDNKSNQGNNSDTNLLILDRINFIGKMLEVLR